MTDLFPQAIIDDSHTASTTRHSITTASSLPSLPLNIASMESQINDILSLDKQHESTNMSKEQQTQSMESIISVFELEEEEEKNDEDTEMVDGDEEDDEDRVDLEDQEKRTNRLKEALVLLGNLWWAESDFMEVVTEKLADGSRDPKWRLPLGNSGILNFYLEILTSRSPNHALTIQMLRLIGNSCADTDENRARLVASNQLSSLISQLHDTTLLAFAIPVLYNICVDYEPAQKQASDLYLTKELIDLISSPTFKGSEAFISYVCKLLEFMVVQSQEPEFAPDNTAITLLRIANDKEIQTDMEDFLALVNVAASYLQHEKFQKALIAHGGLDTTLAVLVDSYTQFDSHISTSSQSLDDQDDAKHLFQMRSNVNQVLSDISALPEFSAAVPVISPFTASLRRWLSSPQSQLQVCACIMLGNLARSDVACEEFVHVSQVHKPLISILSTANDSQLLHATLGFLKNLALPAKNKDLLGESGLIDVLPRLWALDTLQQIQFSSISIARQLIIGTYSNARRICMALTKDDDSPASTRTKLSFLINLFSRTDLDPIKMEISRLVTAICRVYNSLKEDAEDEKNILRRQTFFHRHPEIGRPLAFMVTQTKWPVVRSEGWFVFALMAHFPEGAECLSDLMHDVGVFEVLVELMTGKNVVDYEPGSSSNLDSNPASLPQPVNMNTPGQNLFDSPGQPPSSDQPTQHPQAALMQRRDRMNAMVLLSEMLKHRGNKMAVMRRALFEDLLQGGGEKVLAYNEGREEESGNGKNVDEIVKQSFAELNWMFGGVGGEEKGVGQARGI